LNEPVSASLWRSRIVSFAVLPCSNVLEDRKFAT
jgi:hypothetical protein